jgi:glycosyltransferase involved in cell wall biosynthesis
MPQCFGNGLAMRAALVLEALARRFEVHLFVVPVAGDLGPPSDFVTRHTVRVGILDPSKNLDPLFALIARILDPEERTRAERDYSKPYLSRFCTSDGTRSLLEWITGFPICGIHLMRLYLAPLVQHLLAQPPSERPFCVLDLDDDDVRTYQRLSWLHAQQGDDRAAIGAATEARKYRSFADRYVPEFDCVIVCSNVDAEQLKARFPAVRFAVVPNGYAPRDEACSRRPSAPGALRLLLVGSFGYFPNLDGAVFLCREVLPALRLITARAIRIDVVGAGDATALRGLVRDPNVTVHGFVENLAPFYAAADVAVVPVRAGGGTRIKILEAFAHGVPVVSTRLGVEGIDAADGEHLLLADDAESFARACLRVKETPGLYGALSARAAALLVARYSPARVDAAIGRVWDWSAGLCGS